MVTEHQIVLIKETALKLNQIRNEKEKIEKRIANLQEKLEALSQKEIEVENTEILRTVRALKLHPSELDALLEQLKHKPFVDIPEKTPWLLEAEMDEV